MITAAHPIGRLGQPNEIADTIGYWSLAAASMARSEP
jgi:hypothetical protein